MPWEIPVEFEYRTVQVLNGQNDSVPIDLAGYQLAGILIPATIDGTQLKIKSASSLAGSFQFIQASHDSATDFLITTKANGRVSISNLAITSVWRYIILNCVTAQTADRDFQLAVRPI